MQEEFYTEEYAGLLNSFKRLFHKPEEPAPPLQVEIDAGLTNVVVEDDHTPKRWKDTITAIDRNLPLGQTRPEGGWRCSLLVHDVSWLEFVREATLTRPESAFAGDRTAHDFQALPQLLL